MKGLVFNSIGELLAFVATVLGSVAFSIVGFLSEGAGIQNLLAGQTVIGLWEVAMGALALYFGLYYLGYESIWRRLTATEHEL